MTKEIKIGFCIMVIVILFVGYNTLFGIEAISADYNFG